MSERESSQSPAGEPRPGAPTGEGQASEGRSRLFLPQGDLDLRLPPTSLRVLRALWRIAGYVQGVVVGVRSGQFRVQFDDGPGWFVHAHVSGGLGEWQGRASHDEHRTVIYRSPAAERERALLQRRPMGLPCWISRDDGLLVILPPGPSHACFETVRAAAVGVIEVDTEEGGTLRAYSVAEPSRRGQARRPATTRDAARPSRRDAPAEPLQECATGLLLALSEPESRGPDRAMLRALRGVLRFRDSRGRTWALVPSEGRTPPRIGWPLPQAAHVLSLWNPRGGLLEGDSARQRAEQQVVEHLTRLGLRFWLGVRMGDASAEADVVDRVVLVEGLQLAQAALLARATQQPAFLELQGTTLRAHSTDKPWKCAERSVQARLLDVARQG